MLPDSIANQIAAGEVIQRPASAVKELLENAVDAGATRIQLFVADAGKALVQVVDNGGGMSATDARMCFERHATSKIKNINDLFGIRTMGFRGEALASIAAVAQVELKTKKTGEQLGTYILIEDSRVTAQEPCNHAEGTSISMKNLFFNVPARRNFLKGNHVETRHVVDEFLRVALAFPEIFFSLTIDGTEQFHLVPGPLKQRAVQVLGNNYQSKLVGVKETIGHFMVEGFVGKPETARKSRGDQFLFVNNRFIRSNYLNHAVSTAFEGLIAKDSFPTYLLYLTVDPAQVDINVHPTKQEIKFEDEKMVYAFVQSAVKHSLAQFSVSPSLDFTLDKGIQQLDAVTQPFTRQQREAASASELYQRFARPGQAHLIEGSRNGGLGDWKHFLSKDAVPTPSAPQMLSPASGPFGNQLPSGAASPFHIPIGIPMVEPNSHCLQLLNTYIIVPTPQGLLVVNQQLAHERILYERFAKATLSGGIASQQLLFPVSLDLTPADLVTLEALLPMLASLGYTLEGNPREGYVVAGVPMDVTEGNEKNSIELLLEQYKHFRSDIRLSDREKLVRCMARQRALKAGRPLPKEEMQGIVASLLQCETPNLSPSGSPTYVALDEGQLYGMFQNLNG